MFGTYEPFLLAFIALFVAVDALGNIPLFISLTEGCQKKQRQKIIRDSVTTATLMAVVFMFVGKAVLRFIGITIPDFQIAGGALLFIISVRLLLPGAVKTFHSDPKDDRELGVFPMGTPLITGPAVLTTSLICLDSYGMPATLAAILINMVIVLVSLAKSDFFMKLIGPGGLRAVAKIMYILLASIGVMMVRRGVLALIGG